MRPWCRRSTPLASPNHQFGFVFRSGRCWVVILRFQVNGVCVLAPISFVLLLPGISSLSAGLHRRPPYTNRNQKFCQSWSQKEVSPENDSHRHEIQGQYNQHRPGPGELGRSGGSQVPENECVREQKNRHEQSVPEKKIPIASNGTHDIEAMSLHRLNHGHFLCSVSGTGEDSTKRVHHAMDEG
jgi:hypothetical protein